MVDEATLRKYQISPGEGVFVGEVYEGTPAEKVLVKGDVIVALDGKPIGNTDELIVEVRGHKPGDHMRLTVIHRGKRLDFDVVLAEQPDE